MMRERAEALLSALGEIDERWVTEAMEDYPSRKINIRRFGAAAAAICLLLGGSVILRYVMPGGYSSGTAMSSGTGTAGSADSGANISGAAETDIFLYPAHRADFSPDISPEILSALLSSPELDGGTHAFKVYEVSNDAWFFSDALYDYSQVLSGDHYFAASDEEKYACFGQDEDGSLVWGMTVHTGESEKVTFTNLTDALIQEQLADVRYDDYIVTYSARLYTVIVWARGAEDHFLTYPERPEFTGLTEGGVYTLAQLQDALRASYTPSDPDVDGS